MNSRFDTDHRRQMEAVGFNVGSLSEAAKLEPTVVRSWVFGEAVPALAVSRIRAMLRRAHKAMLAAEAPAP